MYLQKELTNERRIKATYWHIDNFSASFSKMYIEIKFNGYQAEQDFLDNVPPADTRVITIRQSLVNSKMLGDQIQMNELAGSINSGFEPIALMILNKVIEHPTWKDAIIKAID